MSKRLQIYYNAVFGAIGGLLGWLAVGSFSTGEWLIWLAYAFVGSGVGLCIGAMVGAVEGAIVKRSLLRAVTGALLGGLAGMVSGLFGLIIGEIGFLVMQGGLVGRSLGWMFLGLFLGLGEGVVSRKLKRASYGTVGGAIAGLVGGLLYETMTRLFLERSEQVQMVVGALGLIVIGACLGGIIPATVEVIARVAGRGTLVVLNGRRQGLERSVVDAVTLGSYDGCDIYLPGDMGIDAMHAQVYKGSSAFFVRNISRKALPLQIGGETLMPERGERPLRSNEELVLGQTAIRFVEG